MATFPSFIEISFYLAMVATILLLTSQFVLSQYGENHIVLEKNRLKKIALIFALMFVFTALAEIYNILRM